MEFWNGLWSRGSICSLKIIEKRVWHIKTGTEPHYDLSNYMLTSKISYITVHTHSRSLVCDQANVRSETKPIRQGCANMLLHQGYHTPQGAAIDKYKEMVWEGLTGRREDQRNLNTTPITCFSIKIFSILPIQCIYVQFLKQTAIISQNSIKWLVLVYCEVRTTFFKHIV